MPYRLLLFDLDGTLLDAQRSIRPETKAALTRVMAAGVQVGFATGRSHVSIDPYARALRPNGPCVLFNGAMVWDPVGRRVVRARHLGRNVALAALRHAAVAALHVNCYVGDEIWIAERSELSRASERKDGVAHRVVGDLTTAVARSEQPVTKLLLIQPDGDFTAFVRRAALQPSDAKLVHSEPTYLEVLPPGVDKSAGLAPIAKAFHITPPEVIAFGDELNDIEILQAAGLGVAMGNAPPAVRAVADIVIGSHDSDAIARFVEDELRLAAGALVRRL